MLVILETMTKLLAHLLTDELQ